MNHQAPRSGNNRDFVLRLPKHAADLQVAYGLFEGGYVGFTAQFPLSGFFVGSWPYPVM